MTPREIYELINPEQFRAWLNTLDEGRESPAHTYAGHPPSSNFNPLARYMAVTTGHLFYVHPTSYYMPADATHGCRFGNLPAWATRYHAEARATSTEQWITTGQALEILDRISPIAPEARVTLSYNLLGGATLEIRLPIAGREHLVTIHPDGATDLQPAPYMDGKLDGTAAAEILKAAVDACFAEEHRYPDYGPRQDALNQAQVNLTHAAYALAAGRWAEIPEPQL
jgi:hypothetical protein